jgi:DNA-binding NarL/FixJ family response regulator
MMRQGLAQLINHEPDLLVSAEANNAAEAMAHIRAAKLDLALLDISLPDKNGLELIKDIRALLPELPLLVVSMHDEAVYAERVLRAGGRGYIMKQEGGKRLMLAIRQVLAGQIYVSQNMSAKILEIFSGRRAETATTLPELLSDRELEVFHLIGQGVATRDIAKRLHLSIKTVEVHRAHIKQKLKVNSATELVRQAIRWVEASNPQ